MHPYHVASQEIASSDVILYCYCMPKFDLGEKKSCGKVALFLVNMSHCVNV